MFTINKGSHDFSRANFLKDYEFCLSLKNTRSFLFQIALEIMWLPLLIRPLEVVGIWLFSVQAWSGSLTAGVFDQVFLYSSG